MEPVARARLRSFGAALNIIAIALVVPAIIYRHLFALPPGHAPGSRGLLIAVLALTWLFLAMRPLPTPSGQPWPFWRRAGVLVGGHLSTALVMFLLAKA